MKLHHVDELVIEKGYWYVATPYSLWTHGLDDACVVAQKLLGQLLLAGVSAYTPIGHTHPIATFIKERVDPRDHDFWLRHDKPLFEAAHGLLVADLPGWRVSKGVAKEISWAQEHGKPHWLLRPESLDFHRLPL